MTFRYRYEHIVTMKEKEKDQALTDYGASVMKRDAIVTRLHTLQEKRNEWIMKWERVDNAYTAASIHQQNEYLTFLDFEISQVLRQLQVAENELRLKQTTFLEKRKDEKTWNHLREQSRESYISNQNRLEQNMLDEMATVRYYQKQSLSR